MAGRCGPARSRCRLVFPFEGTVVEIPLVYFRPVEIVRNLGVLAGCGHVSSIESQNPFLPYVEIAIRMFGFTGRWRRFFGGSGGACSGRYSRLCSTVGMSVCLTVCRQEREGRPVRWFYAEVEIESLLSLDPLPTPGSSHFHIFSRIFSVLHSRRKNNRKNSISVLVRSFSFDVTLGAPPMADSHHSF